MSPRGRSPTSKAADHSPARLRNALLAALPPAEYARIHPVLTPVVLKHRQVLLRAGERAASVYFPIEGLCSIVTTMEDGRMIEVASVGSEGLAGLGALFAGRYSTGGAIVQVAGSAMQMPVEAFSVEMKR